MPNRPPSAFTMGERVRVLRTDRHAIPRVGAIRDIVWHFQNERYDYYLEEDGRKDSKRYLEEDLESVEK